MAPPNIFPNAASAVTSQVKVGPTRIYSLMASNANAAGRYLQLHNLAAIPTGSEVPLLSFFIPIGSTIIVGTDFFTEMGISFPLGLALAFSTTRDTYTAGSAADKNIVCTYT